MAVARPGRAVYFPNIDLRLVPPNAEANAHEVAEDVVTFITRPAVTKVDVKERLEKVYGVGVERVHTVNYEGKKKRRGITSTTGRTTRRCTFSCRSGGTRRRDRGHGHRRRCGQGA